MVNTKFYWLSVICMIILLHPAQSQFYGTEIDSSANFLDIRKGSTVEYSLSSAASAGDEFRWEVTGGVIVTPSGATGAGTVGDPSTIEFTVDLHTIEIKWQEDDTASGFFRGNIWSQQIVPGVDTSVISKQRVKLWSTPTAAIDENNKSFDICSGDSVGGYIVVNFTGKPDFKLIYTLSTNGLFDETGSAIPNKPNITIENISNDTLHIMLPEIMTNPSTIVSHYYNIQLKEMDDNLDAGIIIPGRAVFNIDVYPAGEDVGTINSTKLNIK